MSKKKVFKIEVAGVPIKVTKKRVKHLRIVAYPSSGEVRISSPEHISENEIIKFASSRADWIKKHLKNPDVVQLKKVPDFSDGSTHHIWGEPYTLKLIDHAEQYSVRVDGDRQIYMTAVAGSGDDVKERVMREWYRRSIKARIPGLIKKWEPVMSVEVKDWGVKKMKTRWGTCNTRDKRIWLNLELAKRKPVFLEYIVVHEMTHLLERGHSSRFYRLMDTFMPEWREIDQQLGGKHWKKRSC